MKNKAYILISMLLVAFSASAEKESVYDVPLYGNSYYDSVNRENFGFSFGRDRNRNLILDKEAGLMATTYVYFTQGQEPSLELRANGKGHLEVSVNGGNPILLKIKSKTPRDYKLGTHSALKDGYMTIEYRLLSDDADVTLHSLLVSGVTKAPVYLRSTTNTYFGLRGPSCHLNYSDAIKDREMEWATISVTVPEEQDQEGSYYMALGFTGGYFGIQNNGNGKRRALFSLWNTQHSDDPKAVSKDNKVTVQDHGEGVTVQDFGNEGSGKQSFIDVGWQPGHTYQFLLHATKADDNCVDYSAWFYDSIKNQWIYLSTLRRPNTTFLLKGLHSFLENFTPLQGNKTRKAYYYNPWARTPDGEWIPLKKAFLTCDDTGNKGKRLDFNGGVEQGRFFLTNGGYFDRAEKIERKLSVGDDAHILPNIDLTQFKH
ncbi:MAG: DUF3472 domain-containing protein [Bacteroidaceae bacterium]|nr:DUF3472 domain-containing protein [Bacteroidaceae bacterium]